MRRDTATLILSFAVFVSFFLPLFQWHSFEMNGFNFILSSHIASYKYLLLFVPFSALFLFVGALENENYLINRTSLSWLPFLSLLVVFFMRYLKAPSENDSIEKGNLFAGVDYGFWTGLVFSFVLMVLKDTREAMPTQQHEIASF